MSYSNMEKIIGVAPDKFIGSEKLKHIIKDNVQHFKLDGWPISVDHILSEMFISLTGVDPILYFIKMLSKKGIRLNVGDEAFTGLVFCLDKKPKKQVKKKTKKKITKLPKLNVIIKLDRLFLIFKMT